MIFSFKSGPICRPSSLKFGSWQYDWSTEIGHVKVRVVREVMGQILDSDSRVETLLSVWEETPCYSTSVLRIRIHILWLTPCNSRVDDSSIEDNYRYLSL